MNINQHDLDCELEGCTACDGTGVGIDGEECDWCDGGGGDE